MQKVKESVYTFEVHPHAQKRQIKEAVELLFSVTVSGVRTAICEGKVRKKGRKMVSKKQPDRKMAYIKVSKGKINLFPQT